MFMYGQHLDLDGAAIKENTEPDWEFYDLEKDPNENYNAYHDGNYQEIIGKMKVELKALKTKVGDSDEDYPQMHKILSQHGLR